jgi:putative hydrolase of the HAD superfamily
VRDVLQPLVLFDLDNTLADRRGTLADWAAEFTTEHGLEDEEQAHVLVGLGQVGCGGACPSGLVWR